MSELNFSVRGESLVGQKMFQVLDRALVLENGGRRIKHLELGEPDQYAPGRIVNETIKSLLSYEVGYAPSGGVIKLREVIAQFWSQRLNLSLDVAQIGISPANFLINQILDVVCDPGDKVVIFTPGFPTYFATGKYIGLDIVEVPLSVDEGFELQRHDVDSAFSNRPKLIIVNSANNPTGAVYSEDVLRYLADQAQQKGVWLLSDETYGLLSYSKPYFSLLNVAGDRNLVISSFSKVFCVPGFRTGYAIGDSRVIEKIVLSSSTFFSCLPIFVQKGIAGGIEILEEFTTQRTKEYHRLSLECLEILKECESISCVTPESAFYLLIDIRRMPCDDLQFASRLLEEYGTATTPGSSFGAPGFIRISFCKDMDQVREGLRDIVQLAGNLSHHE